MTADPVDQEEVRDWLVGGLADDAPPASEAYIRALRFPSGSVHETDPRYRVRCDWGGAPDAHVEFEVEMSLPISMAAAERILDLMDAGSYEAVRTALKNEARAATPSRSREGDVRLAIIDAAVNDDLVRSR